MAQETVNNDLTVRDGVLAGGLRRPVNRAAGARGSIHDDATASKLGFRGGTVAGSVHLDLFPPLLLRAFGPRWFERGTLSMYFLNATTDREPVQAFMQLPPQDVTDAQVDVWVEREDGMKVGEGTASVGDPGQPTALGRRPLDRFEPGEPRILRAVHAGLELPAQGVIASSTAQAERMDTISDRLDWYTEDSPWGAPVVTPSGMVRLLYAQPVAGLRESFGGAVGLFGAIELRNVSGPVLVDHPYQVSGRVLAAGQSPKTEYFWFETGLDDPDGRRVAELRMLLRFMKASSARYKE